MEAIFAGSLDLTYVGQGPALNAHFKSKGEEIRILAGAANAGAALVIKPEAPIKTGADFRGKRIATPQLGNTQDISCRAWLKAQGFKVTQTGGDVIVLPTANPDQLGLFQSGGVDAVWTVEPWVTRLEREANELKQRAASADDAADWRRLRQQGAGFVERLEAAGLGGLADEEFRAGLRTGATSGREVFGRGIATIHTRLLAKLQEFVANDRVTAGNEAVPPEYKDLVERYLRALSGGTVK